ncbi:MAG: ISL3 family transposase, partial [Chloroflexota bacterium]
MRFKLKVPGCCIKAIEYTVRGVKVVVESQALDGICPICGTRSGRVHSYYERQLLDLPLGEMAVRLRVRVRRFRCLRETCQRCTFAESIPKLTERYARHTKRLSDIIWHVGQVAGGRPGSRLAQRLQIPVSRHCMLRLLRRLDIPKIDAVRVLGVDDWAKRRGQTYGTILVDLETRRVIDLLPDREANTLASWLEQHPSVEIVTRDRSTEYANGIAAGAPQAKQVADRWHLLKNLTEMTQRVLRDEWYRVQTEQPTQEIRPHPLPRAAGDIRQKILNREKRLKRYQLVQYFKHKGYSQRRIARVLGLSRGLVRTLYNATAFPERKTVSRSSQLDPYLAYLNTQMKTRKVTARQLWHELVE